MSELNDMVEEVVTDAQVMTVPIDDTLSISGEAADAKAVGDALALKADASSVVTIKVNGEAADNQGNILIDGSMIPVSGSDETPIDTAIENAASRTGADIAMSGTDSTTVKDAIEGVADKTAEDMLMAAGSGTTVAAKIGSMDVVANANSAAITELQGRTGADIPLEDGGESIRTEVYARVRSVNGEGPDETGNVQVQHALTADNLTSTSSQSSVGEFVRRPAGGSASISDGNAWLGNIRGNRVHVGYVPESLNMTVTPAPREEGQEPITATLDHDTFVEAATSGIYNFVYTTSWSVDPETYGITVTGTPVSGDQIVVNYTAEDRGTIIQSDPQSLVSTGWNLYNHAVGYAIGLKYDATGTFKITGTYTAVKFAATITGAKSTITPTDGLFTIPSNGYIFVEGGNDTDTAVYMTWDDWVLDGPETWEAYTESEIDLSEAMAECFPHGLLRVGDVRDEIDLNTGMAISNVQRLAYSAENMASAIASGRAYEADTNYIYLERAAAETTEIDVDGQYLVDDHGLEFITGTDLAVYTVIIYGNNLKNKLERDVLTISAQSLTSSQKSQVRSNIGLGAASTKSVANNLTTASSGSSVLDAYQGKLLGDKMTMFDGLIGTDATISKTSSAEHILTLPNTSRNLVIFTGNASVERFWLGYVYVTAVGALRVHEIDTGSYVTATIPEGTTNQLKFTMDVANTAQIRTLSILGDAAT